jgi:anti-anti-sigma factor
MTRILIIEDSPTQAQQFALMLEDAGFQVERADRLATGLERIEEGGIDALLLDLMLPDSEGLQTFLTARTRTPDTPIVVLTRLDDESLAATAIQSGAQDYLIKGELNRNWLVRSVQHAIARCAAHGGERNVQQRSPERPNQILDIKSVGGVTRVQFNRWRLLGAADAATIRDQLVKMVDSGRRQVLISFANVDYLPNNALSALLAVRRKILMSNGRLRLCNLRQHVYDQLAVRKLHKLFDIREDEESAIRSFGTRKPS